MPSSREMRYSDEFARRVAFAHASETPRSATGDRLSFIGRNGSIVPAGRPAPHHARAGQFGAGLDPCAALHVQRRVASGRASPRPVPVGSGRDADDVERLIARHGTVDDAVRRAAKRAGVAGTASLDTIQVHTPDDSFDVLINRWLRVSGR